MTNDSIAKSSPSSSSSLFTYIWAVPATLWLVFWMLERSYSFAKPLDVITRMNDAIFMPSTVQNNTVLPEWSAAMKQVYRASFYGDPRRFVPDRLHIYACVLMGFIVAWNLWFGPAAKYHKSLGWAYVYLYAVNQVYLAYTLYWIGMIEFGPVVLFGNNLSFAILMVATPLGIRYATQKQFDKHRICMVWSAAALFVNPTQRFFWFAGSKLFHSEAFNNDFGDFLGFIQVTEAMALLTCMSTAAFYTYPGSGQKQSKSKVA